MKAPTKSKNAGAPAPDQPLIPVKAGRGRPRKANSEPMGIQAVEIALAIIAELIEREEGMSLSELSRASGLQPSKLHRYLVSFTRRGLLRQSPVTGQYDFGPLARRVGVAAFNRHHGMSLIHETIATICAESGCTVYLYIWTELGPTLVRTEMGRSPHVLNLREGSALPLCASATGRTFLAYLPSQLTADLLGKEREASARDGDRVWSDKELAAVFETIRSRKIYWSNENILPGAPLAVAPVLDTGGKLHSVITVVLGQGQRGLAVQKQITELLETHVDRLMLELS